MGVDNNAVLFLGRLIGGLDMDKLEGYDREEWVDYPDPWYLRQWELEGHTGSEFFEDFPLIGFEIGDSGSFGYKSLGEGPVVVKELQEKREKFKELFGVEPYLYLFNYMW